MTTEIIIDKHAKQYALTSLPLKQALKREFTVINDITQVVAAPKEVHIMDLNNSKIEGIKAYFVDDNFSDFFLNTNKSQLQLDSNAIAVSKSFLATVPRLGIDSSLIVNGKTFVIQDIFQFNQHSHIRPDVLLPITVLQEQYKESFQEGWLELLAYTYIKINDPVSVTRIKSKAFSFYDKYLDFSKNTGINVYLRLQPIENILLNEELLGDYDTIVHDKAISQQYIYKTIALSLLFVLTLILLFALGVINITDSIYKFCKNVFKWLIVVIFLIVLNKYALSISMQIVLTSISLLVFAIYLGTTVKSRITKTTFVSSSLFGVLNLFLVLSLGIFLSFIPVKQTTVSYSTTNKTEQLLNSNLPVAVYKTTRNYIKPSLLKAIKIESGTQKIATCKSLPYEKLESRIVKCATLTDTITKIAKINYIDEGYLQLFQFNIKTVQQLDLGAPKIFANQAFLQEISNLQNTEIIIDKKQLHYPIAGIISNYPTPEDEPLVIIVGEEKERNQLLITLTEKSIPIRLQELTHYHGWDLKTILNNQE